MIPCSCLPSPFIPLLSSTLPLFHPSTHVPLLLLLLLLVVVVVLISPTPPFLPLHPFSHSCPSCTLLYSRDTLLWYTHTHTHTHIYLAKASTAFSLIALHTVTPTSPSPNHHHHHRHHISFAAYLSFLLTDLIMSNLTNGHRVFSLS